MRPLARSLVGVAALSTAACSHECPEELLPGLCAGRLGFTAIGRPLSAGALVDLDGDGQRELIALSRRSLTIIRPDGRMSSHSLEIYATTIAGGDFDGDGAPEVALLSYTSVTLLTIDASLTPHEAATIELDAPASGLRAADLDGDGRDELLTIDRGAAAVVVVHVDDQAITRYPAGTGPVALDVADLDGDGRLDLVVADFLGSEVVVLRGEGDGRLAAPVSTMSALGADSIAVGDLDGDGHLDVVARGGVPEIWIHLGDGAGGLGTSFAVDVLESEGDARGLGVMPPGSDGVAGVIVPEAGDLSTWLIDQIAPPSAALGRPRRRGSSSPPAPEHGSPSATAPRSSSSTRAPPGRGLAATRRQPRSESWGPARSSTPTAMGSSI
ncbi:MAG: FG-GAP-like repeat-containing protein [Nannocystaceae bacterium]